MTDDRIVTSAMLLELLRVCHTSPGPYEDIMDAMVDPSLVDHHRRVRALERCAILWEALVEKRTEPSKRPPIMPIPGGPC